MGVIKVGFIFREVYLLEVLDFMDFVGFWFGNFVEDVIFFSFFISDLEIIGFKEVVFLVEVLVLVVVLLDLVFFGDCIGIGICLVEYECLIRVGELSIFDEL